MSAFPLRPRTSCFPQRCSGEAAYPTRTSMAFFNCSAGPAWTTNDPFDRSALTCRNEARRCPTGGCHEECHSIGYKPSSDGQVYYQAGRNSSNHISGLSVLDVLCSTSITLLGLGWGRYSNASLLHHISYPDEGHTGWDRHRAASALGARWQFRFSQALLSLQSSLRPDHHHKVTWVGSGWEHCVPSLPVVRTLTLVFIGFMCATDRFVPRPVPTLDPASLAPGQPMVPD